ncbi:Gamma-tubulin complex component-like protein [Emericellopsis cladophorae]|uniref:Spindle pole body component n=1 Tax=Emericellopsis cladophorae TaxID=2686198 RepID=A0A9P9Y7P7_9HYPO|nr:Gamma-tubulin complex component-like protein [Emericellopsis cladophorae]KAI6785158.1 Gamma-tubulin complex component-like protein [Emericellopsis cladophorae]
MQQEEEAGPDVTDEVSSDLDDDLWTRSAPYIKDTSTLRTWDSYIAQDASTKPPPLNLTEAGPQAFESMLARGQVRASSFSRPHGPAVASSVVLASLLALTVGNESALFQRSEDGQQFCDALPEFRLYGFSPSAIGAIKKRCLTCGGQYLKLDTFVNKMYTKERSRCAVALASAVRQALHSLKQHTVSRWQGGSLLQLQELVRAVMTILDPLHHLVSTVELAGGDARIVESVEKQMVQFQTARGLLPKIWQELLRVACSPWTEFLEEWIGTRPETGIPMHRTNLGQTKGFVKVEAEVYTDDFGEGCEEVDFRLKKNQAPSFIPDDVLEMAFETGRSLRFLWACHPEHALSKPNTLVKAVAPGIDWKFEWDAIQRLEAQVMVYKESLAGAIEECRNLGEPSSVHEPGVARTTTEAARGLFTLDPEEMHDRLAASMQDLDRQPAAEDTPTVLDELIRQHLDGQEFVLEGRSDDDMLHWSLIPNLSFGRLIQAQAQVVNREALRELFKSHNLRNHLRLQHDFQLFGNGVFSSRLAQALFDPDLERADRQAGVARQGDTMGLRLGGRDTWPPASSELRLALLGVLVDSFDVQPWGGSFSDPFSTEATDLPGELSFAVRDLSDEEIDKCVNPDSLEALDFLRLSYKVPSELRFVLTPLILMQYDRVFKLMLRVLRLVFVTDQLWREAMLERDDNEPGYRFVRESRHFVASVASYFLDVGVALPWQAFEKRLDKMESSLEKQPTDGLESPEKLREVHSAVLNVVSQSLFLRKRQKGVLQLLEEVFTIVLQYAKLRRQHNKKGAADAAVSSAMLYKQFKKKVQVFGTVCRGMAEKARVDKGREEDRELGLEGLGDDTMVSHLLLKLDINGFYGAH